VRQSDIRGRLPNCFILNNGHTNSLRKILSGRLVAIIANFYYICCCYCPYCLLKFNANVTLQSFYSIALYFPLVNAWVVKALRWEDIYSVPATRVLAVESLSKSASAFLLLREYHQLKCTRYTTLSAEVHCSVEKRRATLWKQREKDVTAICRLVCRACLDRRCVSASAAAADARKWRDRRAISFTCAPTNWQQWRPISLIRHSARAAERRWCDAAVQSDADSAAARSLARRVLSAAARYPSIGDAEVATVKRRSSLSSRPTMQRGTHWLRCDARCRRWSDVT